ncbi:hypothetical protein K435DRAFT_730265 [Dendrothele bispora CBS 962.96]|uniref:Serine/threonine-protein kinase TEL1 n=1 Tax=Dendrothele bispora (strain CBS 962.96) TaxID=1314807 RepID=A0A4S8LG22_DENBC|nr:hypothetical protein K435DRAFT_730265 [Dendrothele bispora CBS 962.96]
MGKIDDIEALLRHDKITQRKEGVNQIRTYFNRDQNVQRHAQSDPKRWLTTFQALFVNAGTEKREYYSKKQSATVQKRLSEVANTIRWLVEQAVTLLNRGTVRSIREHIYSMLTHHGELVQPLVLDYVKALKTLMAYSPHLESTEGEAWKDLVEICFNAILKDPFSTGLEVEEDDEDHPYRTKRNVSTYTGESERDVEDSVGDEDDDDEEMSSTRKRRRRERTPRFPMPSQASYATHQRRSNTSIAVDAEQVAFMDLLCTLVKAKISPILEDKVTCGILRRLSRFLELYPGDTSLHYDFLQVVMTVLDHVSLNHKMEVVKFAQDSWHNLLGLWSTKNKRLKEGLVCILRVLFPFLVVDEDEGSPSHRVEDIRDLWKLLIDEVDNKRGIDPLSMDSLRLELLESMVDIKDGESAFIAKTFRAGARFDPTQALTWAVLELQADCAEKLFQDSESIYSHATRYEGKRQRIENPLPSLVHPLSSHISPSLRVYHLQILLFFINTHWSVLHDSDQTDIMNSLLQLVSYDDGQGAVQSWTFLCFAAIAHAETVASPQNKGTQTTETSSQATRTHSMIWDQVWTHAIRRTNVPAVCRAASHTAQALLVYVNSRSTQYSFTHSPLPNHRVLSEIENLAKDLDVQGPVSPYDSVCSFLSCCLRIASQDVRLFRMQLEDKVLSWLVDCWRLEHVDDPEAPLHLIKDIVLLLETICSCSRRSSLVCRALLPECTVVNTLLREEKTKVIRDFLLYAKVPPFDKGHSPERSTESSTSRISSIPSDTDLVAPRSRERKVSSSLFKSLESLNHYWQDAQNINAHTRASSARRALDVAVTALSFESVLVLNGVRFNRAVIQSACKVIRHIVPLLNRKQWTAEEKSFVLLGLDPLISTGMKAHDDSPWVAMVPPSIGTGIRSRKLKALTADASSLEKSLRMSRMDHLKVVWQGTDVQDMFAETRKAIMDLLRTVAGETPQTASDAMDIDDEDGFAPIRTATVEATGSNESEHSLHNISTVCVSFLAISPVLQNSSGEPTRDKELTSLVLKSANERPYNFFLIGPVFLELIRNEILSLSANNVETFLDELGTLLKLYAHSRDERLHRVMIMFLESTMHLLDSEMLSQDTKENFMILFSWLSNKVTGTRPPLSWFVRDSVARLLDKTLKQDPHERRWDFVQENHTEETLPSQLLAKLNSDNDMRVRFRAASLTGRMFEITRQARKSPMQLYAKVTDCYTKVITDFERMLTRMLSLGNIMTASSTVRPGPFWHLLEACFHSNEYTQHIHAILNGVVQRMGVKDLTVLFRAYASELASAIRKGHYNILRVPHRILGYKDRKECAEATFRTFTSANVVPGDNRHGIELFEGHCRVLQKKKKEGLHECFGDIISYQVLEWFKDHTKPVEGLAGSVTKLIEAGDFSEVQDTLLHELDEVLASMLRKLGDQDFTSNGSIVTALQAIDQSGQSSKVFTELNKYRRVDDFEPHEPIHPIYDAYTILRGMSWLMHQISLTEDAALTYHVLQALVTDVQENFLLNEQFRLINAITLWVAYRHTDFKDPTLLHTLIRGGCALLEQSDLVRPARSLLDWCFGIYRTLAKKDWKDPRFPDILIRISGQCYEHSQDIRDSGSTDTALLTWIDDQVYRLDDQSILSSQLKFALSAWPHQPSQRLSYLYSGITTDSISRVLNDSHISSNKFRLVRQLRYLTSQGVYDESQFADTDFWHLKKCIPPRDQLRMQDIHDFAALLELNKGSISSFGNEQLVSSSHRNKNRRKVREKEVNQSSEDFILQSLLHMLESEDAVSRRSAYDTLRLVLSTSSDSLTGSTQRVAVEYSEEISFLQKYRVTRTARLSRPASDISIVLSSESYKNALEDFPLWIGMISTLFTDILSASNPFYAYLSDILQSQTAFTELVFPRLVQTILQTPLGGVDPRHSCSTVLSEYFNTILSSEHACTSCRKSIIDVVLHLRHVPTQSQDPLAHDKWLNLDFLLLARNAIICGAYTTALLFLELASEYQVGSVLSDEHTEKVMYEIYSNIDEPDGFYGIQTQDHYKFLMKQFHHEKQWEKAFRFHGAALEADMGNASETEGLLNAFQSYGFNHLATQTLLSSISNQNIESTMTYQLGWRTETWDLPDRHDEESPGASLYLALRALHRERDQRAVDRIVEHAFFQEMENLRSLGSENVSQIRQAVQNLMSLSQISQWRDPHTQSLLSSRQTDVKSWVDFMNLDSGFHFSDLESIMATRISLIRSARQKERQQQIGNMVSPFSQLLVEIEKNCLLSLSSAARDAQQIQIALNSVLRAKNLEGAPSFRVSEELAAVLWMHQEPKHAVEFLKDLLRPLLRNGSTKSTNESTDIALAAARLGSWTAEACLEKPSYISQEFFQPAISLLSTNSQGHADAKVYREYAMFAERQYYAILKSPDALRWRFYRERKEEEIRQRDSQLQALRSQNQNKDSKEYKDIFAARRKAEKVLQQDRVEEGQFSKARDEFLRQALEMYSCCLHASDAFDDDAPIRLCSLWLANFNNPHIQSGMDKILNRIASKKFLFLAHQLSARLSSQDSSSQKLLQSVVLRMCMEHPFHILYQVFCLKPSSSDEAQPRRQSGRNFTPTGLAAQTDRSAAAANVFKRLRNDPLHQDRVMAVEELCKASLGFANYPIKRKKGITSGKEYKVPQDQLILKLNRCRGKVPVITANTPVDPSMKYADCTWVDHYNDTFETAGGINLPKIVACFATDGSKHKQLFKGEESDDLRQDAVMEQVFELVNIVLRGDEETRRRNLSVRTYKVIPLDAQSGVLEFVGNTSPLREWLTSAHNRYLSPGMTADKMKEIPRKYSAYLSDKNIERTKEEKLEHYAKYAPMFPPVMRHYFTEKHKTPISWFSMRLNYTRSVATTSIVGHILGLGDRHTSNILLDNYTGEVVHIDLGVAFDQGKLLNVPETVPFRLTRDMVDGMGMSGTDGVFQRCAEETLRVLREGSEVIMTVLEVFRHDPLHNWTVSEYKAKKIFRESDNATTTTIGEQLGVLGINMESGTAEEAADRALSGVARKLDKTLSVAAVVRGLITEAKDPVNLGLIYYGWSPLY